MLALTSRSSLKPMAALAMMAFMLLVFLFGSAGPQVLAQGTTLPEAPENLQAAPNSRLATLTWDDPGDTTITGYKYRQSDGGGSNWTDWAEISGSGATTTSHVLEALTIGTTYTFEIRAVNSDGDGPASSVTAAPSLKGVGASFAAEQVHQQVPVPPERGRRANLVARLDGHFGKRSGHHRP